MDARERVVEQAAYEPVRGRFWCKRQECDYGHSKG